MYCISLPTAVDGMRDVTGRGTSFSLLFRTMYRDGTSNLRALPRANPLLIHLIFLGTGFYILLLTVSVTNLLCMTTAPVRCPSLFQASDSDRIAGLGIIRTPIVR